MIAVACAIVADPGNEAIRDRYAMYIQCKYAALLSHTVLPWLLPFTSQDEELCKASTFVLQACIHQDSSNSRIHLATPTQSQRDHHALAQVSRQDQVSASIDRLENLLRPQQMKSITSGAPSSSQSELSSSEVRELLESSGISPQEVLRMLDQEKLPVSDRVSHWLDTANAGELSGSGQAQTTQELTLLEQLQSIVGEREEAVCRGREGGKGDGGGDVQNSKKPTKVHFYHDLPITSKVGPGNEESSGTMNVFGYPVKLTAAQVEQALLHQSIPSTVQVALLPADHDPTQLQLQNLKAAYLAARANTSSAVAVGATGASNSFTNPKVKRKSVQMTKGLEHQEKGKGNTKAKEIAVQGAFKASEEYHQGQSITVGTTTRKGATVMTNMEDAPAIARKVPKSVLGTKTKVEVSCPTILLHCKANNQVKTSQSKERQKTHPPRQGRGSVADSDVEKERTLRKRLEIELQGEKARLMRLQQAYDQLSLAHGSKEEGSKMETSASEEVNEAGCCSKTAEAVAETRKEPVTAAPHGRAATLPARPTVTATQCSPSRDSSRKRAGETNAGRNREQRSTRSKRGRETSMSDRTSIDEELEEPTLTTSLTSKRNTRYAPGSNSIQPTKFSCQPVFSAAPAKVTQAIGNPARRSSQPARQQGNVPSKIPTLEQQCHTLPTEPSYTMVVGTIGRRPKQLAMSTDKEVPVPSTKASHSVRDSGGLNSHDTRCLACRPRLKCPLITSRNFIKLLKVDHYTCSQHRRLVNRLQKSSTLHLTSLVRPTFQRCKATKDGTPKRLTSQRGMVLCSHCDDSQQLHQHKGSTYACQLQQHHPVVTLDTSQSDTDLQDHSAYPFQLNTSTSDPDPQVQEQEQSYSSECSMEIEQPRSGRGEEISEDDYPPEAHDQLSESWSEVDPFSDHSGCSVDYSAHSLPSKVRKSSSAINQMGRAGGGSTTEYSCRSMDDLSTLMPVAASLPLQAHTSEKQLANSPSKALKSPMQGKATLGGPAQYKVPRDQSKVHQYNTQVKSNRQSQSSIQYTSKQCGASRPQVHSMQCSQVSAQKPAKKGSHIKARQEAEGRQSVSVSVANSGTKRSRAHPKHTNKYPKISATKGNELNPPTLNLKTKSVSHDRLPLATFSANEVYRKGEPVHHGRLTGGGGMGREERGGEPLSVFDYHTPVKAQSKYLPQPSVNQVSFQLLHVISNSSTAFLLF